MTEYNCGECGTDCDYGRVFKNREMAVCAIHYKAESQRV